MSFGYINMAGKVDTISAPTPIKEVKRLPAPNNFEDMYITSVTVSCLICGNGVEDIKCTICEDCKKAILWAKERMNNDNI